MAKKGSKKFDAPEGAVEQAAPQVEVKTAEQAAPEPKPKRSKKRLPRSERHKHSRPAREKPATDARAEQFQGGAFVTAEDVELPRRQR